MVVVCKAGARWPDGILPSRFPWFQPSMPQFSTIGLISRRDNRDIVDTLLLVANFLGKRPGTAVVVDESVDGLLGTHRFEVVQREQMGERCQLVIVVGGDGSMLGAARALAGRGVSASDAAWLSAQVLELAVIRPEQVLKRLYKAMTREDSSGDGGGSGGEVSGGSSSGSDSSTTDAGFAGGGGTSGGSGSSVRYDDSSFAHEAGDTESDSDGFG